MNTNLPDDPNLKPTEENITDTPIETKEDSHMMAVPATSFTDSEPALKGKFDDDEESLSMENPESTAFALSALENVIRQRLGIIEKSQLEMSELGQQLKDIMANSEEYYKADKVAKEAMKVKKQVKATIMGTQEARTLQGKFDESREMLKDQEQSLSDMLLEYYETMHVKEIDDHEGNQRDLIVKVRVSPKKLSGK